MTPTATAVTVPIEPRAETGEPRSPRRRWTYVGPRCPQCAGPLVFGEGCSLCPVCGHSSCTV